MAENNIPIKSAEGVKLIPTDQIGVCCIQVLDPEAKKKLSWDRFIRLNAAANAIKKLVDKKANILDFGGYDGALALFLPEYQLDIIDPATTSASASSLSGLTEKSYDVVSAIDVLEHIIPSERANTIEKLAKIAKQHIVLNYPCQKSKEAQELVLKATNNSLIREHVQWDLPDTKWVLSTLSDLGFRGDMDAYGNLAVWLGQYLTLNLAPEVAPALNRYLIERHANEPFSTPLYHLIICERKT